jgi:hypothetical protein
MLAHLTLYEDVLSSGAAALLPSAAGMIFVVHGAVSIGEQRLGNGNSWQVRPRSFSKAAKRVGQWSGALTLPRGRRRPCSWGGFAVSRQALPPPGPCPKASSSDGAIASPFRLEVALSLMSIRCPEYAASSRAASESTPKADLPPMDRAALGSRAGLSRCSPRQPPIARAALSALRSFLAPLLGKSSIATSTRLIRTNPACRAIRFLWMLGSTAPRVNDLSTDR